MMRFIAYLSLDYHHTMPDLANIPPFLASVMRGEQDLSSNRSPGILAGSISDPKASTNFVIEREERTPPTKSFDLLSRKGLIELHTSSSATIPTSSSNQSIFNDHSMHTSRHASIRESGADELEMMSSDVSTAQSTLLVPPLNFDMICASRTRSGGAIYRSGFPNERNYPFLNTLHLRTIIYLSTDEIRENLRNYVFTNSQRVKLLQFPVQVNKEPFQEMDQKIVLDVLRAILDKRNHPILIHCNKGKYRVGVITALIRRLQGWNMTSIYDEYARFAGSDRIADEEVSEYAVNLVHAK
ncbi:hypothetical protein L7F22_027232 [Adiantum nelumboides]|nr:hypothetical protein [Adiantum nelumboides]